MSVTTGQARINRYGTHYTYYHCTKRRQDQRCRQPSIAAHFLNAAFEDMLSRLVIPDKLHQWVLEEIDTAARQRESERDQQLKALEGAYKESTHALANLVTLRIRDVIDDAEFTRQRQSLDTEQASLRDRLRLAREWHQWFEPAQKLFSFSNRAVSWYREGDDQLKRQILRAVGSNLTLMDKKISIEAKKPFLWYPKIPSRSDLCAALKDVRILYNNKDPELMETLEIIDRLVKTDGLSLEAEIPAA